MSEEIELRHLRYFLAVADTLHFSKAAKRLGMAQPPLSQQIRRLEKLVGHTLFERTTRGVKLTAAGELMMDRARGTLGKIQDDLEQVRRLGRGEEGTLTVGFSGSAILTGLPDAIQEYRRLYPKVELRLREMWTSAQINGLLDGTLDIGFMRDGDPTEGIEMHTMLRERFMVVLPEAHPLAARARVRVKDLELEPFVLFTRRMGPLAFDRTIACCERNGFRPQVVQEAPQWPTLIRLVSAGLGVTLAPACVSTVRMDGVVYREIEEPGRTHIELATKAGSRSALVLKFMEVAQRRLVG